MSDAVIQAKPAIQAIPTKKRPHLLWIELVRLIGIWLVIIGHIGASDFIMQLTDLIILQVLIFVSGYLEKNDRPFKEIFAKSVKGLFIPYLLLSAFLYIYWFFSDIIFQRDIYSLQISQHASMSVALIKPIIGILLSNGQYETSYSMMLGFAMWYLPVVFVIKMAHKAIMAISRGKTSNYVLCLCGSLLAIMGFRNYIQPLGLTIPFCLDRALLLFPFFELGNILQRADIIKPLEKLTLPTALVYILTGVSGFIILGITMPLWDGNGTFLYLLLGTTSIVSVISLSMLYTRQNRIITLLSDGTLLILAFHAVFIPYVRMLFSIFGFGDSLWVVILQSLIILCLFIIPVNVVQKYCPILIGSRKSK